MTTNCAILRERKNPVRVSDSTFSKQTIVMMNQALACGPKLLGPFIVQMPLGNVTTTDVETPRP